MRSVPKPILALAVVLVVVVGFRVLTAGSSPGTHLHPEPTPDLSAADVVSPVRYSSYPEIARAYSQAAEIPVVLDGLYCHCGCKEHSGHRSLLTCFQSDHGASCDICLGEAAMAYRLLAEGASLREIRAAIDAAFGAG